MHAWRDTHGYAQRVYRKSNTHSVTDVHSHISCSIKHDAKRREQHSAIRWVLTDLLQRERERQKDTDSTEIEASTVHLTFDCVCVWKSCSWTTASAQSNWSGSDLPPEPQTNIKTHVSVSYKKVVIFAPNERRKLCYYNASAMKMIFH